MHFTNALSIHHDYVKLLSFARKEFICKHLSNQRATISDVLLSFNFDIIMNNISGMFMI